MEWAPAGCDLLWHCLATGGTAAFECRSFRSSPALRVLGTGLEGTVGLGVEGGDGAGEGEDLGVGELLVELLKVELLGVGAAAGLEKVGG